VRWVVELSDGAWRGGKRLRPSTKFCAVRRLGALSSIWALNKRHAHRQRGPHVSRDDALICASYPQVLWTGKR